MKSSKDPAAELVVRSHVGRDLLASAASFKTEAAVVWEYVVNSLQYVGKGAAPKVDVRVDSRKKTISIGDNGRGMSASDLQHYFTMHGENLERRAGRPGRGKFGTGKSAAFGIANSLQIDTVQNERRNVVRLTRAQIRASDGSDIPVGWLVRDEEVTSLAGTIVTISDVELQKLETAPIIQYIERHLGFFRTSTPTVVVNNHVCEYREVEVSRVATFRPDPKQAQVIGDIELTIRVARVPLPDADQGVSITAGPGNLVAIERAGVDRKEFGSYLFGEVDAAALETHPSPLEPYDSSRSLQLNSGHPVAAALVGFIGSKLEQVRMDLVAEQRRAREGEQARRLASESAKIAELLNRDFEEQSIRLQGTRAVSARQGSASARFGDAAQGAEEPDAWVEGLERPGDLETSHSGRVGKGRSGREAPTIARAGIQKDDGSDSVDPAGGAGSRRTRPRSGFRVGYEHLGREQDRSVYDPKSMAILINLDHVVVSAALGGGAVEDPVFRRLSYEIAFAEYSIALAYEAAQRDPEIPADDLLFDVRATLNRIARSAVALYRS